MEKEFFWKDLSGRGFTNTFDEKSLVKAISLDHPEWEEENRDAFEDTIGEWAEGAEIGDEWNDNVNHVIRIK